MVVVVAWLACLGFEEVMMLMMRCKGGGEGGFIYVLPPCPEQEQTRSSRTSKSVEKTISV